MYSIKLEPCQEFLKSHPEMRDEILKFKPKEETKIGYSSAYGRFLLHKNKLDLTKLGFTKRVVKSEIFGTKEFFDSPSMAKGWDSWGEVFEGVHQNLL